MERRADGAAPRPEEDPLATAQDWRQLGEIITTAQDALDKFHDERSPAKRPPRVPRSLEDVKDVGHARRDGDPFV